MIKLLGLGLVSSLAFGCARASAPPPVVATATATCAGGTVHGDEQLQSYRDCAQISGDLEVRDVCSLSALAGLRRVSGTLSIDHNRGLDSLQGLERLQEVAALQLRDNVNLEDVSQLAQMRGAQRVLLEGNSHLRDVRGLSGLQQLERLSLVRNGFYSLQGLENLRQVAVLELVDNPLLIDAGALNQLNRAHSVVIERNPRLCGWFGLLRGLTQSDQVAMSGNIGLGRSTVARFEKPPAEVSLAAR